MKESILVYIIVAAVLNEDLGILRSLRKKRENRPLFDPGVIVFLCCLPLPSDAVFEPHFREKNIFVLVFPQVRLQHLPRAGLRRLHVPEGCDDVRTGERD